ncbi:phage N-6-adenine-methyltransferase [Pantoea ananatis]|uniref:phage N-6-adenine-methyltransferase n=1 Tax=Pantoea ananas TaxID=553 RepID=UPI000CEB4881|nr:phage N-6-adenine-methyltransferase [Pantoea ananatis]AVG77991.1 phage N-6-adenine-methyltransferase [Pantoea ananatis]
MEPTQLSPYCLALETLRAQPTHQLKQIGDQWRSPDRLWWGINSMFGPFVLDLFADESNAKCEAYYSAEDNALSQNWSERLAELNGAAYANPPYSRASQHDGQYITGMRQIMAHTLAMREVGGRYVFLIKAATGEVWWPEDADHIAFIRGRISFDLPVWYRPEEGQPSESSAGFGAAIAIFDKSWRGPKFDYVGRDHLEARGDAFMRQIERAARSMMPLTQVTKEPEQQKEGSEADESEVPLSKERIISESGYEVWACAAAAFGDLPAFTFSQSKFAHTWAADDIANPAIAAVPQETISKALKIIEAKADEELLTNWVSARFQPEARTEINERLQHVAKECREEYQLFMPDFIQTISHFEHSDLANIRVLRARIREAINEERNDVWAAEVKLIAEQIPSLSSIDMPHQRKVMHHINRMLLERQPSAEIIAAAQSLTATFGEQTL